MASILIVDDERSMREFLEILLRKQGHEVASAADVESALARVGEGDLDLVVSDLRLGSGSGLDVLKAVKERTPVTEVRSWSTRTGLATNSNTTPVKPTCEWPMWWSSIRSIRLTQTTSSRCAAIYRPLRPRRWSWMQPRL